MLDATATRADPALDIAGLVAGYDAEPVLRGVSLRIAPGEAHCLLGANGAGKTTLIRAVLGRVRPRAGSVTVGPDGLGLVPQDIALYPLLTVAENLSAFARVAGVARGAVAARVAETARATGLTERLTQVVGTLSGGWQRRVNIASAILHRPSLLILDEPTVGIDAASRDALHAMIRGLVDAGLGVLMTTHHISEAETVCDHVILLDGGRVAEAGRIERLIEARYGRSRLLTVEVGAGARAAHVLGAQGYETGSGRPAKLVDSDAAGLEAVRALRAAGLRVDAMALDRPGLARLRHDVLGAA